MFDANAMAELAHLKADRYARSGGGGGFKVYTSSKAFFDARGHKELSPFRRAIVEAQHQWRQAARDAQEAFRLDCWVDVDGRYMRDGIPF